MYQFSVDMPRQYRRCDHCIFWERFNITPSSGLCRRNVAVLNTNGGTFPVTFTSDWCGQGQFMDMEDCNEQDILNEGGSNEKPIFDGDEKSIHANADSFGKVQEDPG